MGENNRILVHRVGDPAPWSAPESSSYANEAHLQEVLAASPHWVPGVPEASFSVRELRTSAGPVDVVIVAPDGALTVVECKLESNPEKRRMVIGQVIDYAAAISGDGYDKFRAAWSARGGVDLELSLTAEGIDELRSRIETATIGLCLAVDRIDSDLQRLVEYLNRATHDRIVVTALQLEYAQHEGLEVLIPSTYGGELAAAKGAQHARQTDMWTRESFVEAVSHPGDQRFLARLLEKLDDRHEMLGDHKLLSFGTRRGGVFFHLFGLRHPPFALALNADERLTINGNWRSFPGVAGHSGFAELAAMLGQHESGPSRYVRVEGLNADALWDAAERTARAINT